MEHPRSPRGYTYIMTYRKVIRQLVAENVSNPLAKARRVWYNADTMLDTIFLRNQRNERKNRVKMDCLAPYGANNAERQKSGNSPICNSTTPYILKSTNIRSLIISLVRLFFYTIANPHQAPYPVLFQKNFSCDLPMCRVLFA